MLNITINFATGQARLLQTTAIKAGGAVPVLVTFDAPPGDNPIIEVALIPQSTTRTVLAYVDTFGEENDRTFLGEIDANDVRLINHFAEKNLATVQLDVEVAVESDSRDRRIFPNLPVTVQKPALTGPASSEGGPTYLTEAQSDARYAAASGPGFRITPLGIEIRDTVTNVWRRLSFDDGVLTFTQV